MDGRYPEAKSINCFYLRKGPSEYLKLIYFILHFAWKEKNSIRALNRVKLLSREFMPGSHQERKHRSQCFRSGALTNATCSAGVVRL